MAKEHYIELGGKKRRLAYGPRDAIELKKRFGRPLILILREDVMGFRSQPDPSKPGETVYVPTGQTDLEAQVAFIWTGIRHEDPRRISEEKVLDWVGEHMAEGKGMGDIVEPVWRAIFISGVLGFSLDHDAVQSESESGTEGKAPAPQEPQGAA